MPVPDRLLPRSASPCTAASVGWLRLQPACSIPTSQGPDARAGFLLHPLVRQLGEMEGKTGSSRRILTEAFQRGESGSIEGRPLKQFRCHP